MEQSGVKAQYFAVERLKVEPDGTVEWRMAVSSEVGGMVPKVLTTKFSMDHMKSLVCPLQSLSTHFPLQLAC